MERKRLLCLVLLNNNTCISCRWFVGEGGGNSYTTAFTNLYWSYPLMINIVLKAKDLIPSVNKITNFSITCERGNSYGTRLP